MALLKTALAFICLYSLGGCQSTALQSCRALNWRTLGIESALSGTPKASSFQEQNVFCSKFKTPIDKISFDEGYERGLAQFCTTLNGHSFGEKGLLYKKTCLPPANTVFLKGFYKGRLQFLEEEFLKYSSLYSEAEDRLWRKEREYLIIQNENPEQAKLEVDLIEAYREEARLLAQKKRATKKDITRAKKLSQESFFKHSL